MTDYPPRPKRIKPADVIAAITGKSDPATINAALDVALEQQWKNARVDQEAKGVTFNLTLAEFMAVVSAGRRRTMIKKLEEGKFPGFMKSDSGYCITWKDKAAYETRVMDKDTVAFIRRAESRELLWIKKDDKHKPESIERIRVARTGTTQKPETIEKISKTKTGVSQTKKHVAARAAKLTGQTNTEETKARKSEMAKARWAKARAERDSTT